MKEMDEASDMLREEIAQVHDESKNYMASQVTRLTNPDPHPITRPPTRLCRGSIMRLIYWRNRSRHSQLYRLLPLRRPRRRMVREACDVLVKGCMDAEDDTLPTSQLDEKPELVEGVVEVFEY